VGRALVEQLVDKRRASFFLADHLANRQQEP
jgi:hypothetical protein